MLLDLENHLLEPRRVKKYERSYCKVDSTALLLYCAGFLRRNVPQKTLMSICISLIIYHSIPWNYLLSSFHLKRKETGKKLSETR